MHGSDGSAAGEVVVQGQVWGAGAGPGVQLQGPVQGHGPEPVSVLVQVRGREPVQVWKAVQMGGRVAVWRWVRVGAAGGVVVQGQEKGVRSGIEVQVQGPVQGPEPEPVAGAGAGASARARASASVARARVSVCAGVWRQVCNSAKVAWDHEARVGRRGVCPNQRNAVMFIQVQGIQGGGRSLLGGAG